MLGKHGTKQNRIVKIGITGTIGSGKSTVSSFLKENGFDVVDADIISREILDKYKEVREKIKNTFGDDIFENEKLNRKKLGTIVFNDDKKRKQLEAITIPYIIKEIEMRIDILRSVGKKIVFIDAPTLIEHGLHKSMDYNILITLDEETRISRVMRRDGISREEVLNRIKAQMSQEDKVKYVDFVLENNGEIEETYHKIVSILKDGVGYEKIM
ncbi:dephospho-CoA kinase [Clostridium bornimense]|uniref:Dephospho-CoA kinase n=1 Tax=Clostridium bornimense TaxID=1216932 RepID=W6RYI2_9CLOT|nr:dephospho-CoA kinase [Clostridium bornimense]CDM68684.1 dephospho-CoA kinase [Clostridium bornimense]